MWNQPSSRYSAHYQVRVKNPALTAPILAGMPAHTFWKIVAEQKDPLLATFGSDESLPYIARSLQALEDIFVKTFVQARNEGRPINFPFFSLRLTIWERKLGQWGSFHNVAPLPNYPHCKLGSLWIGDAFTVEVADHDSDPTRGGPLHRALAIRQERIGTDHMSPDSPHWYKNSVIKLLLDESYIYEVFECLKHYRKPA